MRQNLYHAIATFLVIALLAYISWAQGTAGAKPPKMKMTTEVPQGITTPDDIKTRMGELNFFDGVPDARISGGAGSLQELQT